ncbi:hypothetical protein FRC00_013677 [Tulasnella sp. 408]|nr:hypothetical protein FRC00_013677 [Tulasnella sp. 408]
MTPQAYDTIDALSFLHQLNPPVCHGDIKSANVLVNLECRAVLCDFGLARLYEDSGFARLETTAGFKGSIRWCSPELVEGQPRTASSDIYAWAWLVWEIMTGELPYGEAAADYVIMRKIFEGPLPHISGESRLGDCLQPHCPPTPETADPQTRSAVLLENLGELESWKGNHKAAFDYLEQALHLYEEGGNDKGIASVLRKQAAVAHRDSNHVKAMNAASAALQKCKILQDDIGVADALFCIGDSFLMENKRVDALRNLQESLELFRANGYNVGIVKCLERLAELYRRQGLPSQALTLSKEAVDVASRCGDRLGEARAFTSLGFTHERLNDLDKAISSLQIARDIAKNIGWMAGLASCLCDLGGIKLQQGSPAEAEELFRESIRVARSSDAKFVLVRALRYSGKCLRAQDRLDEAVLVLEESCSICQSFQRFFSSNFALSAGLLADSKERLGHKEQALVWYDRAIAEWRKDGKKWNTSAHLASQGLILVDMNRCDEGALKFEASLIIDQELGDEHGVRWTRRKLSRIPKTVIKWEAGRQARLAKAQSLRTTSLLCDVNKLQRRIPQLKTPNLMSPVKPVNRGDFRSRFDYLEQALHLYKEDGNDKGIASVLRQQAAVALRDSNHVKVMNAASAALEKCRTLQDDIAEADALFYIGESLLMENKRVEALRNLQESLKLFRARGNGVGVTKCLERLGELYRRKGLTTQAMSTFDEAVDVASRCGDRLGEAKALIGSGLAHLGLSDLGQAISKYQRAHDIAKNIGWMDGLARCLCRLGSAKLRQDNHAEAEELFRESVRVARDGDAKFTLAQALWHSGKCLMAQDRAEEAISMLEESCSILESFARYLTLDLALAAGFLADSKSKIGHREEASAWYARAIAECRKGGDKRNMSAYLASQGIILVDMNRFDEGALKFEASLIIDQELGDEYGVRWNLEHLIRIPKTVIKWEAGRQARLALAKAQSLQTTSLLCDVKKLERRVPQLKTPNLKAPVEPVNRGGL